MKSWISRCSRGPAIATRFFAVLVVAFLPLTTHAQSFRGGGRGGVGQRSGFGGGGLFRGGNGGNSSPAGVGGQQQFPAEPSPSYQPQRFRAGQSSGAFQQPQGFSQQPGQRIGPANIIRNRRQSSGDSVPANGIGHTTLRPTLPQNMMGIGPRPTRNALPDTSIGEQPLLGRIQGHQGPIAGSTSPNPPWTGQPSVAGRAPGLLESAGLPLRTRKRTIPSNSHWGASLSGTVATPTQSVPTNAGMVSPVLTSPLMPTHPVGDIIAGGNGKQGQGGVKVKGGHHGNAWFESLPWLPIPGPVYNPAVMVGVPAEPVVVPTPVAVDPGTMVVAATAEPTATRLLLTNPADTTGPISYVLDSAPFTMDAGGSQELAGKASWLIEFDRGAGNGPARYSLTDGAYHFAMTDRGWELYSDTAASRTSEAATLVQKDASAAAPADSGQPASGTSTNPATRVVLTNPRETGGPVNFLIDGQVLTVEPASSKELSGKESWIIEFDRGESFGPARYTLTEGSYAFRVDEKGWDLQSSSFNVTLDNTANASDFNFLDGERLESVPAGKTKALSSRFPIVVLFDRGDGGTITTRALRDGETYRVGWDAKAKALDLMAASDPNQGSPGGKPAGESAAATLTQGEPRPEGK